MRELYSSAMPALWWVLPGGDLLEVVMFPAEDLMELVKERFPFSNLFFLFLLSVL